MIFPPDASYNTKIIGIWNAAAAQIGVESGIYVEAKNRANAENAIKAEAARKASANLS